MKLRTAFNAQPPISDKARHTGTHITEFWPRYTFIRRIFDVSRFASESSETHHGVDGNKAPNCRSECLVIRAGHRHPYKAYVRARNTVPVYRTGHGIGVAGPYPMYGLWVTVHNRILDGRIRFIYGCTGINININLNPFNFRHCYFSSESMVIQAPKPQRDIVRKRENNSATIG